MIPLGALGLLAIVAIVLGALVSMVGLGGPFALAVRAGLAARGAHRRAANRLLDAHIPPLPGRARVAGSAWRRTRHALADRHLWRVLALLALSLPLGVLMLVVAVAPIALTAGLLSLGAQGVGGYGDTTYLGPWSSAPPAGSCSFSSRSPPPCSRSPCSRRSGRRPGARRGAAALGTALPGGPVREMLAESLGDRTLSIAYWLPDSAHRRRARSGRGGGGRGRRRGR